METAAEAHNPPNGRDRRISPKGVSGLYDPERLRLPGDLRRHQADCHRMRAGVSAKFAHRVVNV